ncbi:Apoptosis inhibitor 5/fibroblast growth factor 2-interacting factor 2 [Pelomyxa schiedti]|nr:Apoptosis inhibitor 5/fibroblast growth factor 2-interacting factor 2 [Pelomyxa schiedti]
MSSSGGAASSSSEVAAADTTQLQTAPTSSTAPPIEDVKKTAAKETNSGDAFVARFYDISTALTTYMEQQKQSSEKTSESNTTTPSDKQTTITAEQAASMYDELLPVKEVGRACKLSAQLLPKFVSLFPGKVEQVGNALFDLCEDPNDVGTRILAVRALPLVARAFPDWASKAADVVVQLLAADIPLELDNVKENLLQLLTVDKKGVLEILFNFIIEGGELLRARCISFLLEKVIPNKKSFGSPEETEQIIINEIKRVMGDVSASDLRSFFNILNTFTMFQATDPAIASTRSETVSEMLLKQVGFPNLGLTEEYLSILLECCEIGAKYSAAAFNTKFVEFFITKILPVFEQDIPEATRQTILMRLVDASAQIDADSAKPILDLAFSALLGPKIIKENAKGEFELEFTQLEVLLLLFHRLASKVPAHVRKLSGIHIRTGQPDDFTTGDPDPKHAEFMKKLKDIDVETTKNNQQARKKRDALGHNPNAPSENLKEREVLDLLLKSTTNIKTMAQALLKSTPSFLNESSLKPSWAKIDVVIVKKTQTEPQSSRKRQPAAGNAKANTTTTTTRNSTTSSVTTITTPQPSPPKKHRQDTYVPPARRNLAPLGSYTTYSTIDQPIINTASAAAYPVANNPPQSNRRRRGRRNGRY